MIVYLLIMIIDLERWISVILLDFLQIPNCPPSSFGHAEGIFR